MAVPDDGWVSVEWGSVNCSTVVVIPTGVDQTSKSLLTGWNPGWSSEKQLELKPRDMGKRQRCAPTPKLPRGLPRLRNLGLVCVGMYLMTFGAAAWLTYRTVVHDCQGFATLPNGSMIFFKSRSSLLFGGAGTWARGDWERRDQGQKEACGAEEAMRSSRADQAQIRRWRLPGIMSRLTGGCGLESLLVARQRKCRYGQARGCHARVPRRDSGRWPSTEVNRA